ncbi:MAG: methylthioribulose 1-phosphate dehydratase [Alphaproteobacteria bacterium]
MTGSFEDAVSRIIRAGNRLDRMGLAPATSGNYSIRTGDDEMAITVSGAHKGQLSQNQVMRATLSGVPLEEKKPSAETLLHCQIYKVYPHINAILHTHSVANTVLSRLLPVGQNIDLEGYELLKAYPGIKTHETKITLPVFDNTQDMIELSDQVQGVFNKMPETAAYIIRSHGIYGWGADMDEAERVIEATEFLLSCELEILKIKGA